MVNADNALFPIGEPAPAVAAMERQIDAWQASGRALSVVVRRMLIDQAHAVDLARSSRRATQVSGASRVMLELLQGFRLLDDGPAPADDPFTAFVAAVAGDTAADDG